MKFALAANLRRMIGGQVNSSRKATKAQREWGRKSLRLSGFA